MPGAPSSIREGRGQDGTGRDQRPACPALSPTTASTRRTRARGWAPLRTGADRHVRRQHAPRCVELVPRRPPATPGRPRASRPRPRRPPWPAAHEELEETRLRARRVELAERRELRDGDVRALPRAYASSRTSATQLVAIGSGRRTSYAFPGESHPSSGIVTAYVRASVTRKNDLGAAPDVALAPGGATVIWNRWMGTSAGARMTTNSPSPVPDRASDQVVFGSPSVRCAGLPSAELDPEATTSCPSGTSAGAPRAPATIRVAASRCVRGRRWTDAERIFIDRGSSTDGARSVSCPQMRRSSRREPTATRFVPSSRGRT